MGCFRLQHTSMTLNKLERQFTALSSVYDQTAEARVTYFTIKYHYISAIGVLSSTTKFKMIPFEFQALISD